MATEAHGKIGILVGQLTQMGGVGIAAVEEVGNLRELGVSAELVVLKERKGSPYAGLIAGLPVRYLSREIPWPLNVSLKIPFFSFFNLFHLTFPFLALMIIRKEDYRCLIVHETYNALTALVLKRWRKIPYYPYVWDPVSYILPRVYARRLLRFFLPWLLSLARWADRLIIKEAAVVIVSSQQHAARVRELFPKARVRVIPAGCHPQVKIPERRGDFILALTKWDWGKNPFFLLEVLGKLKLPETKLIMGGNWTQPSLRKGFEKRAAQRGLTDRIEITGRIDEDKKTELFLTARVLVHPIFEAFGMFGLEAAACGCPVVIPQGSGVTELFADGVHGFFPKEGDVAGFAEALNFLLVDKRRAWTMGEAAWEAARQHTWESHARDLLAVISPGLKVGP